jgi:hypothetical protein
MTRHVLIAVLFFIMFGAFVVAVVADSLAIKSARRPGRQMIEPAPKGNGGLSTAAPSPD